MVGYERVAALRREGRLTGHEHHVDGWLRGAFGYARADVEAYIRSRGRSRDGRSWSPLDPAGKLVKRAT